MRYFVLIIVSWTWGMYAQQPELKRLKKHVAYLAHDRMKGRETGDNEKAARYIAREFAQYGLQPQGTVGYLQPFTVRKPNSTAQDQLIETQNVVGYLDNGAARTVVIGAHYDHVGRGEITGSRDELGVGKIHNGADDNASGVAGLLELARIYSTNKAIEPVNFLFIAFGAEEWGLLGSRYFVSHPTVEWEKLHWMLNMDMIGRLNENGSVAVIGFGTSPQFQTIYEQMDQAEVVKHHLGHDGRGGSDNTSFYDCQIPVLFFHTGAHADYHKPTDDAKRINYEGLLAILELERLFIEGSFAFDSMEFTPTTP